MRNNRKIKLFLIILSLIFRFSILFSTESYYYQENSRGYLESNNEQKLKSAGYWELGPIEIDDNIPSKNWLYTATTYDWCSGSGTFLDPYIIENITIDGGYTDACILIKNSHDSYFIIRNCTVYNSGNGVPEGGIVLQDTDNGVLIDNNCSNNNIGIYLGGDYNIISGNNCSYNNVWGIISFGYYNIISFFINS